MKRSDGSQRYTCSGPPISSDKNLPRGTEKKMLLKSKKCFFKKKPSPPFKRASHFPLRYYSPQRINVSHG